MLAEYIEAAMSETELEWMEEESAYFGRVTPCQGVWALGETKEICLKELRETLEEWIVLMLRRNWELPVIKGISLNLQAAPLES